MFSNYLIIQSVAASVSQSYRQAFNQVHCFSNVNYIQRSNSLNTNFQNNTQKNSTSPINQDYIVNSGATCCISFAAILHNII